MRNLTPLASTGVRTGTQQDTKSFDSGPRFGNLQFLFDLSYAASDKKIEPRRGIGVGWLGSGLWLLLCTAEFS